ncbi:MAG: DUF1512 domain-containing protein [Euryarchaeota archaeon]|nr:DUF1512 domain-containing protein [Euryarchaeota archaeon]
MLFNMGPFDILGILIFILVILILPWAMRTRMISSVTKVAIELEKMVEDAQNILIEVCREKGNPPQDPSKAIQDYIEFFVVPPVDLDPYGIVNKFEKIMEMGEDRFKQMADVIAPAATADWRSNIIMTLKATIGINSVAKIVRHNLELARKTGSLQILLMLQMSLPLILRIVKAQFEGTKAFSEGKPIGDGLGPLVAGMLMSGYSQDDLGEMDDMVVAKKQIDERNVTIVRAQGPGGKVGKIGKVITSIINEKDIKRIITIDAAVKLEGEETGKIAEGIGIVIGGFGIDRWMIEEELTKRDLNTDAIIVKMSPEEAIGNINKKIVDASKKALSVVERSILRSKKGTEILVVGVGNSCGLPNIISDLSQIEIKKEVKTDKKEGKKWLF